MNKQFKAFVFDLDGVIVDTAKYHFLSWRELAKELGFEIPDSLNEDLKGLGRMESLEKVLKYHSGNPTDQDLVDWAHRKNEIYLDNISHIGPGDSLPGVIEFLQDCRDSGLKTALGSGSKNARAILVRLELTHMFSAVCDGNDISRSKPDPEIFQCACAAIEMDPADVVVFEDATSGLEAARRCGTATVGVGDPDVLGAADHVIPGFTNTTVNAILDALK